LLRLRSLRDFLLRPLRRRLLAGSGLVRLADDLDRLVPGGLVKQEGLENLRDPEVTLELDGRTHMRMQLGAGEPPSERHDCGPDRRCLPRERVDRVDERRWRVLAHHQERRQPLVGMLGKMLLDPLCTLL
jgi:hypothetical protein